MNNETASSFYDIKLSFCENKHICAVKSKRENSGSRGKQKNADGSVH